MCTHRHPDLWDYDWISAISASFRSAPAQAPEPDPAHRHRVRSSSRSRATETFLRSETVSSTYSWKTLPLFFFRSSCFACCLEARSLCFTGGSVVPSSLCHPWERACVFMGRMLCPYDPRVNSAVIVRSKSWHQSGGESCLFSQRVWSGWDDWRQTSHLIGSHTMREKSTCYDVTLCAWFQLSALLACKAGKDSRCVLLLYYKWVHSH